MSNFVRPQYYNDWTDGDVSKVTRPDNATLLQGWVPGQPPPPDYLNWLTWNEDEWTQFLDPVMTVTAGENIPINTPIYISDGTDSRTNGRAYKTDASASLGAVRHRFLGFTLTAILNGQQGIVVFGGKMAGFTSLAIGDSYWLDPATPGAITNTQPTTGSFPNAYIVPVGTALTTTVMQVNPALAATSGIIPSAQGAGVGTGGITSLDPSTQSPFTMSAGNSGLVFWIKSSLGAMQMNLPAPQNGLIFTVVDIDCNFNLNPLTWHRHASEKIQGVASDYVCRASGGAWSIQTEGTDWAFTAK